MKNGALSTPRPYRQSARAAAAEETAQKIIDAFAACMRSGWFDEITLDEVAGRAGVTERTVFRRFGGKDGLLEAFVADFVARANLKREAAPGKVGAAIAHLVDLYEEWGDSVIRNLAQESRHPALKPLLDAGRSEHRAATAATYAHWLDRLAEGRRREALDTLVAATDIYLWKLWRRDMGRSRREVEAMMLILVGAVLADLEKAKSEPGRKEP
jgi:AcrR family transcriptional regulator